VSNILGGNSKKLCLPMHMLYKSTSKLKFYLHEEIDMHVVELFGQQTLSTLGICCMKIQLALTTHHLPSPPGAVIPCLADIQTKAGNVLAELLAAH
jgi:hypothetical protein